MKISQGKQDKISEQILFFLFSAFPQPQFTTHIAQEIARDEEFVKKLLGEMKKRKLVLEVKKNSKGIGYLRRSRWKLSEEAYDKYQKYQ